MKNWKKIEKIETYLVDQQAEKISEEKVKKVGTRIDEGIDSYMLCTLFDIGILDMLEQIYPQIQKKYIGDIFTIWKMFV